LPAKVVMFSAKVVVLVRRVATEVWTFRIVELIVVRLSESTERTWETLAIWVWSSAKKVALATLLTLLTVALRVVMFRRMLV
jgi:hypothetical protein